MSQSKNMATQASLIDKVCEIYRESVHFKLTLQRSIELAETHIWHTDEFRRLPHYNRSAVRSIYYHLFHGPADLSIYQHLEYRMLYKGKYYANFDAWRAEFPTADASEIQQGNYFWKGTDKEY